MARLVGRAGLQTFLADHQGRDVYRHRLSEAWAQELFGWKQLNAALTEHRLHPPRLRLEKAGADASKGVFRERRTRRGRTLHDLEPAVLNARLRDGATLILDAANELSPPLQQLCAGLSGELLGSCQANLYAAWGETQGFNVHWDAHDVFVVQVEGRKRWALCGVTRPAPSVRDNRADHPRPETPIKEVVLEPGDMLYLPRGYWHAAVGLGEPTLHLTIGVTRKTGTDFLHWLANEAEDQAIARADLPLESDDDALSARLVELIAALSDMDPADLARGYRRHVEAALPQRAKLSLPFIGAERTFSEGDRFVLADGPAAVRSAGEAVVLRHRGVDYTVASPLERALARWAAGEALSYRDLETSLPADAAPQLGDFVAELLGRGVLVRVG